MKNFIASDPESDSSTLFELIVIFYRDFMLERGRFSVLYGNELLEIQKEKR